MAIYLRRVNSVLPLRLRIDHLKCQVGSINVVQSDQIWLSRLCLHWQEMVQEPFLSTCVPAFIDRKSGNLASLVIYASQRLDDVPSLSQSLFSQIFAKFPQLQNVLHKVWFLHRPTMNVLQEQKRTCLYAESIINPQACYEKLPPSWKRNQRQVSSAKKRPLQSQTSIEEQLQEIFNRALNRNKIEISLLFYRFNSQFLID